MGRKPDHRPQAQHPPTWTKGGQIRADHRQQPTAVELDATRSTLRRQSGRRQQGRCETTLTERFANPDCRCPTYPDNLGPCAAFEAGGNGRCVYCDHEAACYVTAHPGDPPDGY